MSGHIYFLTDESGAVKIGFTTQLQKRIKSLSAGSKSKLTVWGHVAGTREHERALHDLLSDYRLNGEWFRVSDSTRLIVKKVLKEGVGCLGVAVTPAAELAPIIQEARDVAKIVVRYAEATSTGSILDRLRDIEDTYQIPRGTLWMLHYRPNPDMRAGAYFALLRGASEFLANIAAQVERDSDLIDAIRQRHARAVEQANAAGAEVLRLEAELAAIRANHPVVAEIESVVGEEDNEG